MALYWCCSFLVSVPVLWTLLVGVHAQGVDRTREEGAFGRSVVLATILRLQEAGVSDTERFLRRVAFVESRDGADGDTFRSGYYGGIWQVDEVIFDMTQNVDSLSDTYDRILNLYSLNWNVVTWQDLRQPLLSAIAAALFFELAPGDIPDIGQVRQQGKYWKSSGFNTRESDTVEVFFDRVTILESEDCLIRGIDLAFVLDSSGSIGAVNFQLVKNFVAEVVQKFDVGPLATLVALITYSNSATVRFTLNNFTSSEEVLQAVSQVNFTGGGTNTATGLIQLRENVFTAEGGARSSAFAVPRIAVVLTDGRSNVNASLTVPSALALREEDGVTIYAVGVGPTVDRTELVGIAGTADNVRLLGGFNEVDFENLRGRITNDACMAVFEADIAEAISIEVDQGDMSFFEFEIPEEGMTLSLERQEGFATLYASKSVRNPNSALYDYRIDGEGEIFVEPENLRAQDRQRRQSELGSGSDGISQLFVSVEGIENGTNSFQINTSVGNTIEITTTTEDLTTTTSETQETTSKRVDFLLVVVLIPSAVAFSLVTATVVLVLIIGIGVLLARRRKRKRQQRQPPQPSPLSRPLLSPKATEL